MSVFCPIKIYIDCRLQNNPKIETFDTVIKFITNNTSCAILSNSLAPKMKIKKFSVLKSPFIYKKHWAQYEIRTHSRILPVSLSVSVFVCWVHVEHLQVTRITGRTADIFLEYIQRNLPEGVNMMVEKVEDHWTELC